MSRCKCKCCKCCCTPNMPFATLGLAIGLSEFIIACVYNFHTFGFGAGIVCFGLSGLFLNLTVKRAKEHDNTISINHENESPLV